ncbi:unnamed protein product [Clonostachys solani]|uniref:Nucleotide exchange factor SIL1 n=1 Tax=Clonostachys solani TaxID=160281 RepID=A0A9N9ZQE3_9HYPO|nr:unnamed protein product [Clonostachys solani]
MRSSHVPKGSIWLFALFLIVFSALVVASEPQPSPAADEDLICHTSNPDECYPRIFQPTDEFQIVQPDQHLPEGLHVRLDITTGKKEAKINVPDEVNPALEGLPVNQAVMVVDSPASEEPDTPPIPRDAPEYDILGKVREPKPSAGSNQEAVSFYDNLKLLKSPEAATSLDVNVDKALEALEDISHDIYYGLKIAEDTEAVNSLLCLMTRPGGSDAADQSLPPRDQQAASVLAGALSNNPNALQQVAGSWSVMLNSPCPDAKGSLGDAFYGNALVASGDLASSSERRTAASRIRAKVGVINGLIKDDYIRAEFLKNGGMSKLLRVLIPEQAEWAGAQRKVGQLALDNFLDEDMGAILGQWPTSSKLDDKECQSGKDSGSEGCWDYHVARIMKSNSKDKEHWSRDLNTRLGKARKSQPKAKNNREL